MLLQLLGFILLSSGKIPLGTFIYVIGLILNNL